MAFNPSPQVAAARDFAQKFDRDITVILSVNTKTGRIEYASYGATSRLCSEARKLGDKAFDAIYKHFEEQNQ